MQNISLMRYFQAVKADFQILIYRPSLTKLHGNGKFINQGNDNVHPLVAPPPLLTQHKQNCD